MDTKQRILDEALTLFATKGYANVFVSEIADRVGIRAPSLYKHYRNKQAIFDAIIDEMNRRYLTQANTLHIDGADPAKDLDMYAGISEERLIEIGTDLFLYFLHDDYMCRFRKLLTVEQFHNDDFARLYTEQYFYGPLTYQGMLFKMLIGCGALLNGDADIMALEFYAPIYTLLTVCDREPEREEEALELLKRHIRQFNAVYGGGK